MNVTPNPPSQPWTDTMRSKLADHRQEPPAGLWEAIERDLSVGDAVSKSRRKSPIVWIAAASVIAAIGITWSLYTLLSGDGIAQQLAQQPETQTPHAAPTGSPSVLPGTQPPSAPLSAARILPGCQSTSSGASLALVSAESQTAEDAPPLPGQAVNEADAVPGAETAPEQQEHPQPSAADTGESADLTEGSTNKRTAGPVVSKRVHSEPPNGRHTAHGLHRRPLIALHLRCDGTPLSQAFESGLYDYAMDNDYNHGQDSDGDDHDGDKPQDTQRRAAAMPPVCRAPGQNTTIQADHYMPIRLGAMVEIGLTDRIAFTTGLNYAHLSSEVTERGHRMARGYDLNLDYLGLPVGVQVSLWRRGGLEVVAGGGAALEKCVSNRMTHLYLSSETAAAFDDPTRLHPWQWSLQASAGIHYHFARGVGLYLQPTFSYYFDDGSALPVYYDDHPFCPTLELGLTFKIKN